MLQPSRDCGWGGGVWGLVQRQNAGKEDLEEEGGGGEKGEDGREREREGGRGRGGPGKGRKI